MVLCMIDQHRAHPPEYVMGIIESILRCGLEVSFVLCLVIQLQDEKAPICAQATGCPAVVGYRIGVGGSEQTRPGVGGREGEPAPAAAETQGGRCLQVLEVAASIYSAEEASCQRIIFFMLSLLNHPSCSSVMFLGGVVSRPVAPQKLLAVARDEYDCKGRD